MRKGQIRQRRKSETARWGRWALLALGLVVVAGGALLASLPDVKVLSKTAPKSTAFIDLRRAQAAEAKKRFALRWLWRPLAEISPHLRHAVVITEDAKFWDHDGVDWDAVEAAAERNWEMGRFALGGSTITQQLAKNLYLSPSKNPVRKLRELLIARRLEAELSKERLLELYLNVVEWGEGVFGAEAAARFWFGRPARELTPTEAARLALALPNPRQRSPKVRSRYLDRRAAGLLRIMWRQGVLSEEAYQSALPGLGVAPPVAPAVPTAPPASAPLGDDELLPPSTEGDAGAI